MQKEEADIQGGKAKAVVLLLVVAQMFAVVHNRFTMSRFSARSEPVIISLRHSQFLDFQQVTATESHTT